MKGGPINQHKAMAMGKGLKQQKSGSSGGKTEFGSGGKAKPGRVHKSGARGR